MAKVLNKLDINWRDGSGAHRLLLDKAKLLASTEEDSAFDLEEADEVIDELEALFFYGNLYDTPALLSMGDISDFAEISFELAAALIQLKERAFRYQALPRLCELANGGPKVCQYCYWAMQRIGRGRNSALSHPTISDSWYGCIEYSHLCAVDSSPTLPSLEQRSREGCVLCNYLREHYLSDLQEPNEDHDSFGKTDEPFYVWLLFDWNDKPMQGQSSGNTLRHISLRVMQAGSASEYARTLRCLVGSSDGKQIFSYRQLLHD